MILRWLLSRTVRQAGELRSHVLKLVRAQQDLLSPTARDGIYAPMNALQVAVASGSSDETLRERMESLEGAANEHLVPYPNSAWRENVEVLLVALAVALGVRTFILQPFKIPTGSMQPTLYGIHQTDLRVSPEASIPTGWRRIYESWVHGTSYYRVVAKTGGELRSADGPKTVFPFVKKEDFQIGDTTYTVWFPPESLLRRGGAMWHHNYQPGEEIINLKVTAGDHLFVNRVTYNFRRPRRGEIVVFETKDVPGLAIQGDQFYIKRLVGLGGEHLRIGDDRHLIVNGERLDAATPHFEFVYSFVGDPEESHYSGHVNGETARRAGVAGLAPYFPNAKEEFVVRPQHYVVMGDNTLNSADSRSWGDFPQENVIGKSCFVYWPVSERFGWTPR